MRKNQQAAQDMQLILLWTATSTITHKLYLNFRIEKQNNGTL